MLRPAHESLGALAAVGGHRHHLHPQLIQVRDELLQAGEVVAADLHATPASAPTPGFHLRCAQDGHRLRAEVAQAVHKLLLGCQVLVPDLHVDALLGRSGCFTDCLCKPWNLSCSRLPLQFVLARLIYSSSYTYKRACMCMPTISEPVFTESAAWADIAIL